MSAARDKEMLAARLRHRMRIEQPVLTPDGLGGNTRSWQEVATVWAEIKAVSSRERLFAGQLESRVTHRVKMRHRSDVSPKMRLLHESRLFTIRAVIDVEEGGRILEILAEEGVAS